MTAFNRIPKEADHRECAQGAAEHFDCINIWLVDDSQAFRSLLAEFLGTREGFECTRHFPSAEAVLEALAREPAPDVILLDINMGGLSGLDAIRPIKAMATATHVIMLTTFGDNESRTRALRDGASDYILKSFAVDEIPIHIRQIVEYPITTGAVPPFRRRRGEVPGSGIRDRAPSSFRDDQP